MIIGILLFLLIISICVSAWIFHENRILKKERDYYHEVDEENDRLRKIHGEK